MRYALKSIYLLKVYQYYMRLVCLVKSARVKNSGFIAYPVSLPEALESPPWPCPGTARATSYLSLFSFYTPFSLSLSPEEAFYSRGDLSRSNITRLYLQKP